VVRVSRLDVVDLKSYFSIAPQYFTESILLFEGGKVERWKVKVGRWKEDFPQKFEGAVVHVETVQALVQTVEKRTAYPGLHCTICTFTPLY
jgi:hypothetical protein